MYKKKILITGCSGMLGSELSNNESYNFNILSTSRKQNNDDVILDITLSSAVEEVLNCFKPDIIINCAAYTNVDLSEKNKKIVHDVNVNGLKNLIKYSTKDTKIVHISSDYVFDGMSSPYYEDSLPKPVSYYGKTKLESENTLIGSNRKYLIIRPNVLYTNKGNNFFTFVFNSLRDRKTINVVTDQISNPVYVPYFVKTIFESIIMECEGLFHFGSNDSISRYDFANKIGSYFKFDNNLIKPIKTKDLKQTAQRPKNSTLNCDKIKNILDIELYRIDDTLIDIDKYYAE